MKKTHIILLVGIAALIVGLISYSADFSTYDTVQSARQKQGKFVHLIAKLDKRMPLEYDPINNPNYLTFYRSTAWAGKRKLYTITASPLILKKVNAS